MMKMRLAVSVLLLPILVAASGMANAASEADLAASNQIEFSEIGAASLMPRTAGNPKQLSSVEGKLSDGRSATILFLRQELDGSDSGRAIGSIRCKGCDNAIAAINFADGKVVSISVRTENEKAMTYGFSQGNDRSSSTEGAWDDVSQKPLLQVQTSNHVGTAEEQIIGGANALIGEVPWIVRLNLFSGNSGVSCGGTLIAARIVLTAAHCFGDSGSVDSIIAYYGSNSRVLQLSTAGVRYVINSGYVPIPSSGLSGSYNDIALILLSGSPGVSPVTLSTSTQDVALFSGQYLNAAGWGLANSGGTTVSSSLQVLLDYLQISHFIPLVSNAACSQTFSPIFSSHICAGWYSSGIATCQGDSGGPLFTGSGTSAVQFGITSYGPRGCDTGRPGVYTRVSSFQSWIALNSTNLLASVAAPPANDNFLSAILVSQNTNLGTNVGATAEAGEPSLPGTAAIKTVWWKWVPTSSGVATITTAGSSFDTKLAIYSGNSLTTLTRIAYNDDAGGSLTSAVAFSATANTTYYIQVDGYNGASGSILLNITPPAPQVFTFSVALGGRGDGSIAWSSGTCRTAGNSCSFTAQSAPTITATANPDSIFAGWGGVCSGRTNTASIPVSGSRSCTATFVPQRHLLWKSPDQTSILWLMNGLQKTDGMKLQDGSTGWVPVSFADSTGDGWDDILFRHTSGALIHWGMRGLAQQSSAALLDPGAGWSLVARGDFDGDGRSDILFQHADGTLIAWTMNGATKTGGFVVGQMAAGWRVIWIGDFNRDGKEDILIANDQTGSAKIYFSNGLAISGTAQLDAGAGWQIGAIGNFDGTGNLSVVWRQNDGFSILWPLRSGVKNGGYVIQQPASGAMPIMQRADFDGDGIDDILWEYPNGDREITLLNASGIKTKAKALTAPNDYSAAVLKDFDGDGKTDIVWANPSGSVILWTMDGSSQTGGALLASGSAFLPKAFGPIVQ